MVYIKYKVNDNIQQKGGSKLLNRLFGNYLVEKKCITQEQLNHLLPVPSELIADLETIAIVRKVLTPVQVQTLLTQIGDSDTRFGEAALEEGLISDNRLDHLISFQTNSFMKFVQLLINESFIRIEQMNQIINSFQTENEYTDSQMDSLMLDDLEEIVKIFVPLKSPQLQELTVTLIQTIKRLIDKEVYLDKAYAANSIQLDSYAGQAVNGDLNFKLYLSGAGNNLLGIINYFSGEKYSELNDDALDNAGEFINCVNGLFATNLSYGDIVVDMSFPEYSKEGLYLNENKLFVIPIHANGFCFRAVYEIYQ